ncbi:class I SAM-dependent methyltransferase [Plantactinospora sp. KLBMP9567]|uniref:class I SAM-dependent methyltransferase n=1 Tax=Plantactinospora sp. KLBMP9567 TaxID=3085900 RepID=UPI002980AD2D|nr:class I SAM-dependent methyltransferase [Plantactinospora sp. KLBMP9567]MDW5328657.1 class I SAM-dependent methyltransferase [Plantactinospora sp. KLBMP9567]
MPPAGAGRGGAVRPVGAVTRGTTTPNRLRRVDNWIAATCGDLLRDAHDPLVVDLGYGASPVTVVELRARLAAAVRPDVRVVGLEIDPVRVAAAAPAADPPWLVFGRGGFELAGLRPVLVRAFNVLRQYAEPEVAPAWRTMTGALQPGGVLVEGTCDELGRLACWLLVDATGPRSLTLAARLSTLDSPATLAERLPKTLIHHNVPGTGVHALIRALEEGWRDAAPYATFGPRQRWRRTVEAVRAAGWPVLDRPARWRLGEVTVAWPAVAPPGDSPVREPR